MIDLIITAIASLLLGLVIGFLFHDATGFYTPNQIEKEVAQKRNFAKAKITSPFQKAKVDHALDNLPEENEPL